MELPFSREDELSDEGFAPEETSISIESSGFSDAATKDDSLGFNVYSNAIAAFLLDRKTKPPLTMSVEGGWGSGKSSLMLQIEARIRAEAASRGFWNYKTIWFNAWQHDKAESMWAAFALNFVSELAKSMPFWRRFAAKVKLAFYRFNWEALLWKISRIGVVFIISLIFASFYAEEHIRSVLSLAFQGHFKNPIAHTSTGRLPNLLGNISVAKSFNASENETTKSRIPWLVWIPTILAAFVTLVPPIYKFLNTNIVSELATYATSPDYKKQVNLISQFQTDFSCIVKSYLGQHGRAYVFIDDLDRSNIPGATNLAEALNLLLSACGENLIFIIGLDRNIVAAGITAKYSEVVRFLDDGLQSSEACRNDYGHSFLEKFIQIPFRIPKQTEGAIGEWLAHLMEDKPTENDSLTRGRSWLDALFFGRRKKGSLTKTSSGYPGVAERTARFVVEFGPESNEFRDLVARYAQLLSFNPRRIKVFINFFRLKLVVSFETGLLDVITVEQLALFTAITTKWPQFLDALIRRPGLLRKLIEVADGDVIRDDEELQYWASEDVLMAYLGKRNPDLYDLDVAPLLAMSPKRYATTQRASPNAPPKRAPQAKPAPEVESGRQTEVTQSATVEIPRTVRKGSVKARAKK